MIIIIGFAGCLYPLWPSQLRGGVYYLSWGGLGFVGFVIVLAICKSHFWLSTLLKLDWLVRTILFCLIWLFSGGHHHLWIFPNLTEDCGPIESFFPFYTYQYKGNFEWRCQLLTRKTEGPKIKKNKKKKSKAIEGETQEAIEEAEADPKPAEEKKDD